MRIFEWLRHRSSVNYFSGIRKISLLFFLLLILFVCFFLVWSINWIIWISRCLLLTISSPMGCFQSRDEQPYCIWPLWRHMFNLSVSANRQFTFRVERKDFWLSSLLHGWYLVSITSLIGEWQNCIFYNLSSKNGFKRDMRCLSKLRTFAPKSSYGEIFFISPLELVDKVLTPKMKKKMGVTDFVSEKMAVKNALISINRS